MPGAGARRSFCLFSAGLPSSRRGPRLAWSRSLHPVFLGRIDWLLGVPGIERCIVRRECRARVGQEVIDGEGAQRGFRSERKSRRSVLAEATPVEAMRRWVDIRDNDVSLQV